MDVVGSADPYFIAKLDDHCHFVSTVISDTLGPVWNETWRVKNVPSTATLSVKVMDKDNDAPTDDYIGKFETSVAAGAKEVEIQGPILKRSRGHFWFKIEATKSGPDAKKYPYLFDGPIRFSRHFSPTVGRLTSLNDARLYSTWKVYITGIPLFFGATVQPWNKGYKAAQSIFKGPASLLVRSGIQAGHRMLYARTTHNGFGTIGGPADVMQLLTGAVRNGAGTIVEGAHRVKPAVYTYIISAEDDSLRFSETGAAFFVDFASKHALHSNCAEAVRYSGEFHPRPRGGWAAFGDDTADEQVQWELVIDNNSGTYSPDKGMLPQVKALLEHNFPGFTIYALDHADPELEASTTATRAYAKEKRGIREDEFQPHTAAGEVTLSHMGRHIGHQAKVFAQTAGEDVKQQLTVDVHAMLHPHAENVQEQKHPEPPKSDALQPPEAGVDGAKDTTSNPVL
ncbi:hypothetical protein FIBSPDRAFT_876914 [Athelia psychrophila]|uniref:C2 domain-containing protein n=1 Tax=Athelia psychrophila TaxID=1759441 RepID=A0A167WED8_9AGAM|nr:hypothetical protein FIBSPDRAFT_876914 [Fibularhizoctonia sp. CBS 109695]